MARRFIVTTSSAKRAEERARVREALVALVGERGFEDLELDTLLASAEVSEQSFARNYADLEDCYHQAYTEVGEEFMLDIAAAFGTQRTWRAQLRAVAYELLDWVQADAGRARFAFVESLKAGEATQAKRDEFFFWLFTLIDYGRQEMADPEALSPATASAIIGAIYFQIRTEIEAGRVEGLDELAPKLIYSALSPYIGAEEATLEVEAGRP